jgi:ribulose 1,5-bisphosphate synthetase/thiazole synthase
MSPCRVLCHLGRMGLADVVVVGAGGVAVEAGAAVAGAAVVAEEPELSLGGMSQTWGWQTRRVNWMVCWRA